MAIFGAAGFIGKYLLKSFIKLNPETLGVSRKPIGDSLSFDLAKPDITPLKLIQRGVTHAIIASAVTGIGTCERDPEQTHNINVKGTIELSRQLSQEGIKVITFSSDYVFDGGEGDYDEFSPVNPLNEYGRQKAEVEAQLSKIGKENYLILRLSKVFDLECGSGTLLDEMTARLSQGGQIFAAYDQIFCPTYIGDIVHIVISLIKSEAAGLINVCSPETISRVNIAKKIAETLNVNSNLVKEILLKDLGESFRRPRNTSLISKRLDNYIGKHRFRPLTDSINEICLKYREYA